MYPLKDWSSIRFDKQFTVNTDYKVFNDKIKIVSDRLQNGNISSLIARMAISIAAVDLIKSLFEKRFSRFFNH